MNNLKKKRIFSKVFKDFFVDDKNDTFIVKLSEKYIVLFWEKKKCTLHYYLRGKLNDKFTRN